MFSHSTINRYVIKMGPQLNDFACLLVNILMLRDWNAQQKDAFYLYFLLFSSASPNYALKEANKIKSFITSLTNFPLWKQKRFRFELEFDNIWLLFLPFCLRTDPKCKRKTRSQLMMRILFHRRRKNT